MSFGTKKIAGNLQQIVQGIQFINHVVGVSKSSSSSPQDLNFIIPVSLVKLISLVSRLGAGHEI